MSASSIAPILSLLLALPSSRKQNPAQLGIRNTANREVVLEGSSLPALLG